MQRSSRRTPHRSPHLRHPGEPDSARRASPSLPLRITPGSSDRAPGGGKQGSKTRENPAITPRKPRERNAFRWEIHPPHIAPRERGSPVGWVHRKPCKGKLGAGEEGEDGQVSLDCGEHDVPYGGLPPSPSPPSERAHYAVSCGGFLSSLAPETTLLSTRTAQWDGPTLEGGGGADERVDKDELCSPASGCSCSPVRCTLCSLG